MEAGRKERLDRMKKWGREHREQIKEANRRLYERRRAEGVCVRCGHQDDATKRGAARCSACSAAESERRKRIATKGKAKAQSEK